MNDLSYDTITVHMQGKDMFAHYAEAEEITRALVEGIPIVAMCGKIWIPTRAPDSFPICPRCKEMYDQLSWLTNGRV